MSKQTEQAHKTAPAKAAKPKAAPVQQQTSHLLQLAREDPASLTPAQRSQLQRTFGNRALSQLVGNRSSVIGKQLSVSERPNRQSLIVQPKLQVNAVGDKYEQEADAVAKEVVQKLNAPQPTATPPTQAQRQTEEDELTMAQRIQRQELPEEEMMTQRQELDEDALQAMAQREAIDEEEMAMPQRIQRQEIMEEEPPIMEMAQRQEATEDELQLQRQEAADYTQGGTVDSSIETQINQSRGGGKPMDDNIRQPMEQAFGADFSNVRIHTNAQAHTLNQAIQARAFTTGRDIYFKEGKYSTNSSAGQELLAHELTHVVQQTGGVQRQAETPNFNIPVQASEPTEPVQSEAKQTNEFNWGEFVTREITNFLTEFQNIYIVATPPESDEMIFELVHPPYMLNSVNKLDNVNANLKDGTKKRLNGAKESRNAATGELSEFLKTNLYTKSGKDKAIARGRSKLKDIEKLLQSAVDKGLVPPSGGKTYPDGKDMRAWLKKYGIGVDCSAFVQQMLIELVQKSYAAAGMTPSAKRNYGVGWISSRAIYKDVEQEIKKNDRFEKVHTPGEVRPGDIQVKKGHIRIVISTEHIENSIIVHVAESTPAPDILIGGKVQESDIGPRQYLIKYPQPAAAVGDQLPMTKRLHEKKFKNTKREKSYVFGRFKTIDTFYEEHNAPQADPSNGTILKDEIDASIATGVTVAKDSVSQANEQYSKESSTETSKYHNIANKDKPSLFQLTFNQEVGGKKSLNLHFPKTQNSGVTLGPGYDMKGMSEKRVLNDLLAIGINEDTAEEIAKGAPRKKGFKKDKKSGKKLNNSAQEFVENWKHTHPDPIITTEQEKELFNNILVPRFIIERIQPEIRKIGNHSWHTLSGDQKAMLFDVAYNPGLSKFPKFTKAVLTEDWEAVGLEHRRYHKINGKKVEARRNKRFEKKWGHLWRK